MIKRGEEQRSRFNCRYQVRVELGLHIEGQGGGDPEFFLIKLLFLADYLVVVQLLVGFELVGYVKVENMRIQLLDPGDMRQVEDVVALFLVLELTGFLGNFLLLILEDDLQLNEIESQ